MRYSLLIVTLLLAAVACTTDHSSSGNAVPASLQSKPLIPYVVVNANDTALALQNGVWYYQKQPFSGIIETRFVSGVVRSRQSFYNGKEEGVIDAWYEDGTRESQRYYRNGEKDSINQGWWPNGKQRYAYQFSNGEYEGDFKEWYASGKPLKHIIYHKGKEQSGTGWRENGKIYMRFVMRDGRLYGLINPNLCYSLQNQKGEFRESVSQ